MQTEQLRNIINDLTSQLSQRSLELAVSRSEVKILTDRLRESEEKAANVQEEAEVIVKHTN